MPGADVEAALERQAAPGFVAGLAGPRDRVEAPEFAAVDRVVGGDEAAAGGRHRARPAADHLAVGDDRAGRVGDPGIADARFPYESAGVRVEPDDVRVHRRDEQAVFPDRDVAGDPAESFAEAPRWVGALRVEVVLFPAVLPDQVPVPGVEGRDDIVRLRQEDDAAAHERRRLVRPVFHRRGPGEVEEADRVAIDLVERGVAPARQIAAKAQPVAIGSRSQFGIRDRRDERCARLGGDAAGRRE